MDLGSLAVLTQRLGDELDTTSSSAGAGMGIGVTILTLVIGLAALAFHIYVLVDILKHSDAAWQSSGQNKNLWIGLWVLAFCCGGIIIDLIYWFAIRPKLTAAGGAGGQSGYTGYAQ